MLIDRRIWCLSTPLQIYSAGLNVWAHSIAGTALKKLKMYTIEDVIAISSSKVCEILNKYAHKSKQRLTQIQLLEQKLLIVQKCFFQLKENNLNKKEFK